MTGPMEWMPVSYTHLDVYKRQALDKGYHLVLEKPISPLLDECLALQKKAHEANRVVVAVSYTHLDVYKRQVEKQ